MEASIDEEDNKPLTTKDFVDFLNKEENEPLRFLLGLQLYKIMKEEEEKKNGITKP